MSKISEHHIREFERQGCCSWDEYCNLNELNYDDLFEDDEEDDEDDG